MILLLYPTSDKTCKTNKIPNGPQANNSKSSTEKTWKCTRIEAGSKSTLQTTHSVCQYLFIQLSALRNSQHTWRLTSLLWNITHWCIAKLLSKLIMIELEEGFILFGKFIIENFVITFSDLLLMFLTHPFTDHCDLSECKERDIFLLGGRSSSGGARVCVYREFLCWWRAKSLLWCWLTTRTWREQLSSSLQALQLRSNFSCNFFFW